MIWYLGGRTASLSQLLPMLQSMGVIVLEERPFTVTRADGLPVWIYQFKISVQSDIPDESEGPQRDATAVRFADAVTAIWHGRAEIDRFNELVLRAGLTWQQVVILRTYAKYLRQAGFPYSQAHIEAVLNGNPGTSRALVELFEALFDPAADPERKAAQVAASSVSADIDALTSLDTDRVLRGFASMIQATLRTNYFVSRKDSARAQNVLSIKLNSRLIDELPLPRPMYEIFVYSPRVEGVHLRFGFVARGGLRWSDRKEDFRTEILGLVKAQAVKNAVIVPVGAKGGFVVKQPPSATGDAAADRDAQRAAGIACYKLFISGLLDITDNVDQTSGKVVTPADVVRRDGDDAYLVVAADKGTATFSDIANEVAKSYGFWLGDAFASGGSVGYDHKAMGITAKGAWEAVKRHFREMGVDTQTEDFTVVGIGDMSGDVFGNGMLLSEHIRLVAAFNHLHVFLDPNPDAATSWQERKRMFELPRSTLGRLRQVADQRGRRGVQPPAEVDPDKPAGPRRARHRGRRRRAAAARVVAPHPQGAGGPAVQRRHRHLHQGRDGVRRRRRRPSQRHDPGERKPGARQGDRRRRQPRRHLAGPCRVRPRRRPHQHRRAGQLRRRRLLRPRGQHQDPDRRAGEQRQGAPEDRTNLLLSMTDEVGELVLVDNKDQNDLMGTSRANAASLLPVHARQIKDLESDRGLNRELEALPSEKEIRRRTEAGIGLTSPELATLMAHVKLALKDEVLASELPDQEVFAARLPCYFPTRAARTSSATEIRSHQLRREIVTTMLVNDLVDAAGISYVYRVMEDVGVGPVDAVRSYVATNAIFRVEEVWRAIRATSVPVNVSDRLTLDLRRQIDRAGRWLLNYRPQPLAVGAEINRFAKKVAELTPRMREWLRGDDRAIVEKEVGQFSGYGVPEDLAYMVASGLYQYSLLDIIDIADIVDRDPAEVADTYFALMDYFNTDSLLTAVSGLPREDRWHSLARLAIRDDIYGSLRSLCFDVLAGGEPEERGEEKISGVGAYQRLSRKSGAAHAEGDLRIRRARPGDVVGGGAPDSQHDADEWNGEFWVTGFVAPVHVRWSDIDMYQHINHATMVTILEEARIPFLREPFEEVIDVIGLLIHEVKILYKGQLRLRDSPLQVTMWSKRVRAVDFTIGYEVRSVQSARTRQAGRHRRDTIGYRAHQRAAPAASFACPAGVSAALDPMSSPERGIWLGDATHREDLATFVERAVRLDDAAVIRLSRAGRRSGGGLGRHRLRRAGEPGGGGERATGRPERGADALARGLAAMDRHGHVDPGFPMDSAWRGALPPDTGFVHIDDVPARVVLDLAQRGVALAKEHGSSHGPPVSLLDQEVLAVSSDQGDVDIPMRCVFALTAMGFLPQSSAAGHDGGFDPDTVSADEIVRVRALPAWLRIDARFGSVYRRRGDPALVLR